MVHHGTDVSKDLLLETFGNPKLESLRFGIVRALIRIGHEDECRTFMENAVSKSPPYKGVHHLDLHEQCCGREASIEVCTKRAKEHSSVAACQKLASLFEDTRDPIVSELILDKLFCEGKGKHAVLALELLEQIGNSNLAELWAKLPEATTSSDPMAKFYQHWHTQGIARADIVKWINKTLQPETPISVDSVLNKSKFLSKVDEHYLWRFVHEGFDSRHKFAMAALAHSGSGDLAFGEDMYRDELIGYIADLAVTETGELKVSSVSSEVLDGQRMNRMVVNNRLYEFPLAEPVDYQLCYDARAIVELLNTIAIRQRQTKRFFAYPTEWDTGFCLVLFIEPKTVSELETKFGLSPIDGCEFYLHN